MDDIYIKVGSNIAAERKKQKITAAQLAEGVKRSRSFISDIENGRTKISLELLFDIAKFLKVPIHFLSGESEETYEDFLSPDKKHRLEQIKAVLEDKKDEVWTYKGVELPREIMDEVRRDIETIIAMRQYEVKKRRPIK